MLSKVEVTNQQGATLVLPLQNVFEGYVIQDIEGLDPVSANIVSSSFAQQDGEQYQSSRRDKRNIVLKLGLEASLYALGTVRELRTRLYQYLMPKSEVRLRFFDTDGTYVDINGRVEDFSSKLFVKEPEATISILCLNPDFVKPEPVILNANTVSNTSEFMIDYEGTVDTGLVMRLSVNRALNGFTIYHRLATGSIKTLEFAGVLSVGDVLEISTVSGAKGATLFRAGSDTPILYGVSPYSNWITLEPGPNYLRVHAEGAAVPYSLEYTVKIGGL